MQCHLSKMRITDLSEGSVIDSDHSNSVKSFDLCCYFFTACFEVVCWTGHALDYTLAIEMFLSVLFVMVSHLQSQKMQQTMVQILSELKSKTMRDKQHEYCRKEKIQRRSFHVEL